LIAEYIVDNPLLAQNPKFHSIIIDDIWMLINDPLTAFDYDTNARKTMHSILAMANAAYFSAQYPPRAIGGNDDGCYMNEFYSAYPWVAGIARTPNQTIIKEKITRVRARPQPDQRTPEWYTFRNSVLTASNAWKALGSQSQKNQLIFEKCVGRCPEVVVEGEPQFRAVNTDNAMHWGQKYEPISTMLYEHINQTSIEEFGCVPHATISHLAASPDGIITDMGSPLYGRMVEIKNIVNRDITGNPKMDYWIQMQLQMEVCDLNDCDFLETRFMEYDNYDDFVMDSDSSDPSGMTTIDGKRKGSIIQFDKMGVPQYEYAPIGLAGEAYGEWELDVHEKHKQLDNIWVTNLYWWLEEMSCVLVMRNLAWFNAAKPVFEDIWKTIIDERETGYQHRAPKSRNKNAVGSTNDDGSITPGQCMIVVEKCDVDGAAATKEPVVNTSNGWLGGGL
jgi:putative phage-type endonuclease